MASSERSWFSSSPLIIGCARARIVDEEYHLDMDGYVCRFCLFLCSLSFSFSPFSAMEAEVVAYFISIERIFIEYDSLSLSLSIDYIYFCIDQETKEYSRLAQETCSFLLYRYDIMEGGRAKNRTYVVQRHRSIYWAEKKILSLSLLLLVCRESNDSRRSVIFPRTPFVSLLRNNQEWRREKCTVQTTHARPPLLRNHLDLSWFIFIE